MDNKEYRRRFPEKPSPNYRIELEKLQEDIRHWEAFDGLVDSVPEDRRGALRGTFQDLHDHTNRFLLDSQKLDGLKEKNKLLFGEVMGHYLPYLKKLAGIE